MLDELAAGSEIGATGRDGPLDEGAPDVDEPNEPLEDGPELLEDELEPPDDGLVPQPAGSLGDDCVAVDAGVASGADEVDPPAPEPLDAETAAGASDFFSSLVSPLVLVEGVLPEAVEVDGELDAVELADAFRLRNAVTSVPVLTMDTMSQPSADFSVSLPAREAES